MALPDHPGAATEEPAGIMGKQLVIVESPAKAKTINRYLGPEYVVEASVGHVRDLPKSAKGQPIPGVDIEKDFTPSYVVSPGSKKVIANLKKLAKGADEVWFATDLDREGEAIAWHLAEELKIDPASAKRVVFNAITKAQIEQAFANPHAIDMDRVNAQQTRRILDRIVGYQVSPLLWKRVAGGLSAGRVQSVAVRMIVERENLIRAHVPDEHWEVQGFFAVDPSRREDLETAWASLHETSEDDKPVTKKERNRWLGEHNGLAASLVELDEARFDLSVGAEAFQADGHDEPEHIGRIERMAEAIGLSDVSTEVVEDPAGKGPASRRIVVYGTPDPSTLYRVDGITKTRSKSRPGAPFITSSLQSAAASALGFTASRTMRAAQKLYEGITVRGEGQVGLITYMRTDSTHVSPEAIKQVREYIKSEYGDRYLPEKPVHHSSTNRSAQEAHEAIRPTDATRHPDSLPKKLDDDLRKLYRLIWSRFVSGQMVPAEWDRTEVRLARSDTDTGAVFKANGRVLAFDGFYRASGIPASDEQTLPSLEEGDELAPFALDPEQRFSSPPSRFSESALVKQLEKEGIGRPSTYASIIDVIQRRNYVEKLERSFHPTFLGEVVTGKLVEGFPTLMDIGFTKLMEADLDSIAAGESDWVKVLKDFYGPFTDSLEYAYEHMTHAKAETEPAIYKCPECGARTEYRLGKNGRFISCASYPDCKFAATVDRNGKPMLIQRVNVQCPEDGSPMVLRSGRFGPFLASVNYPDVKMVVNLDKKKGIKYPSIPPLETDIPCSKCDKTLNLRNGKRGPWLGCSGFPKCRGRGKWTELEDAKREELENALASHEKENPQVIIKDLEGRVIEEGTPIDVLLIVDDDDQLEIHPDVTPEEAENAGS
ncbi:MAG: DNA topoisomerase 1 [Phycisphaerae bacterium]|nr:DNA topoisomerase 1 [Phycisphaerae bacterium]